MRDFLNLSFATILSLFIFVACDKDEKIPTPPGEKAIQDVIDKLENIEGVSEFTEALKNVRNVDLENDQITVFAVKDENIQSTLNNNTGSLSKASSSFEIKRHIAAGRHDLSSITTSLTIESINGDKLEITKEDKGIYINGIELADGKPVAAGNSYIYVVADEIPKYTEPEPIEETEIRFMIHQTNNSWSPEYDDELFESENATISIYTKSGDKFNLIIEITTSQTGEISYMYSGKEELYFTVKKDNKSPFYEGYRITGLFTSSEQIDNSPAYQTGTDLDYKIPGSLQVADLNGDGIVNSEDKVENEYLICDNDEINEIIIGELISRESIDFEFTYQKAVENLGSFINEFIVSDYNTEYKLKYGDVNFPGLNNFKESETVWSSGYDFINLYIYSEQLFNSYNCPEDIKNRWNDVKDNYLADIAYIYGALYNYFGNVPIVTETSEVLPARNNLEEIINYLEMIKENVNNDNKYVVSTILARLYISTELKDYQKTIHLLKDVLDSGKYDLSAYENVYDNSKGSDKEIIYGDFAYDQGFYKTLGKYAHPILLREVYLTLAECYNEIGQHVDAIRMVNIIFERKNEPIIQGGLDQASLREIIRDLAVDEFEYEDKLLMFYKRWGTFLIEMGNKGAEEKNKVLPIPLSAINTHPSLTQNPGY